MNQLLNTDNTISAEDKLSFKKLDVLLGQPISTLLLKNMLHDDSLKAHFELIRSQVHGYISEQSRQSTQVSVEFDNAVLVVAHFNYERQDDDNFITYHVYAIAQPDTDDSTESIHKYETSSLIDAYSFANNLLEQRKYLPVNMWGKDVFC